MAAVLSSCAVELPLGKNTGAKYKAKAEYAYQSYHSTRLPIEPLIIERRRETEEESKGVAMNQMKEVLVGRWGFCRIFYVRASCQSVRSNFANRLAQNT